MSQNDKHASQDEMQEIPFDGSYCILFPDDNDHADELDTAFAMDRGTL